MTYPIHQQPRGKNGRFIAGAAITRRHDGEWSWTRWLGPEDEPLTDVDLRAARSCLYGIALAGIAWGCVIGILIWLVLR